MFLFIVSPCIEYIPNNLSEFWTSRNNLIYNRIIYRHQSLVKVVWLGHEGTKLLLHLASVQRIPRTDRDAGENPSVEVLGFLLQACRLFLCEWEMNVGWIVEGKYRPGKRWPSPALTLSPVREVVEGNNIISWNRYRRRRRRRLSPWMCVYDSLSSSLRAPSVVRHLATPEASAFSLRGAAVTAPTPCTQITIQLVYIYFLNFIYRLLLQTSLNIPNTHGISP